MFKIQKNFTQIVIYQTYYDDLSKSRLDPKFLHYYNEICDKYMEGSIISKMSDLVSGDYFGVVGTKISRKALKWDREFFLKEIQDSQYDFYYTGLNISENIWLHASRIHHDRNLIKWVNFIFEKIGFKNLNVVNLKTHSSFCNYHVCRSKLYKEWIDLCLIPFIKIMENNEYVELQKWLEGNAFYNGTGEPGLSSEKCLNIFGKPYYTKHPFIIERLFPTYAAYHNWTGKMCFTLLQ